MEEEGTLCSHSQVTAYPATETGNAAECLCLSPHLLEHTTFKQGTLINKRPEMRTWGGKIEPVALSGEPLVLRPSKDMTLELSTPKSHGPQQQGRASSTAW